MEKQALKAFFALLSLFLCNHYIKDNNNNKRTLGTHQVEHNQVEQVEHNQVEQVEHNQVEQVEQVGNTKLNTPS